MGPTVADADQPGWEAESGNLLPADRAGVLEPQVERDVPNPDETHVSIDERGAKAYEQGFVQVNTAGTVAHGRGDLAIDGAGWVESAWRPRESGRHRLVVRYEHSADHFQETMDTGASAVLTSEPNLAVVNDETGEVVAHSSAIGSNAVSAAAQEYVIEELLTKITRYILLPGVGLVGKIIAEFVLGRVFDHIIDIEPRNGSVSRFNQISLTFPARSDTTYRIRFTANNGFSGRTTDEDEYFVAESSSLYELTRFAVEPFGFGGGGVDNGGPLDGTPEGGGNGDGIFSGL